MPFRGVIHSGAIDGVQTSRSHGQYKVPDGDLRGRDLRFHPVSARDHRHGSVHKLVEPVGSIPRPGSDHSLNRLRADFAPLANFYGIVIMRVPISIQEYPLDDLCGGMVSDLGGWAG